MGKKEYHYARGMDLEFGVANDKEQVAVRFRFEGGPRDGETMAWFGFFTEKTEERTLESLRYCGWDTDDLADAQSQITRNLVQLVLEDDEYQGKVRKRIAWVNKTGGPLVKNTMDEDAKRAFFLRMKGSASRIDKRLAEGSDFTPPKSNGGASGGGSGGGGWDDSPFPEDDIGF